MSETSVLLSMGSNLGDRESSLERGVREIGRVITVEAVSSVYETEPVGYDEQPWFLNLVVKGRTRMTPKELLCECKRIERDAGRTPTVRFGPRPLDLDILLYGDRVIRDVDLTVPHPRMHERAFVLVPLLEISPDAIDPQDGTSYAAHLERLGEGKKVRPSLPRES